MTSRRPHQHTFHLTLAKRRALEILAEYFCLRSADISRLLRNREPNESDLRTTRRTTNLLWKEGLLNRLPWFELTRDGGNIGYIYGLSDKAVNEHDGQSLAKSFDEHSARTLDHELEISLFHIATKRMCEGHGVGLYWQQSDLKRGIHPDALIKLNRPKGEYAFFLEIEKAKKNFDALTEKFERYSKYYDTDDCLKDWGFRKFRVIVVQKNEVRRLNLLKEMHGKLPHRMFWLTTESLYRVDIAAPIFKTPKDYADKLYSFLSL